MMYNLTKNQIDFFLSYQFIEDPERINASLESIQKIFSESGRKDVKHPMEYYTHRVEETVKKILQKVLESIPWKELWILFSGGVDSFILTSLIRKYFPEYTITVFTFFPRTPNEDEITRIHNLAEKLDVHCEILHREIRFPEIIAEFQFAYKHIDYPIWDEGFIFNSLLFREIQKVSSLKYFLSGDGLDVLFGWLSMYKLSLYEQWELSDLIFSNTYEEQYFQETAPLFEKEFFYKYGEYFWWNFIGEHHETIRKRFFHYFNTLWSIGEKFWTLRQQILYNIAFLMEMRKDYIHASWAIHWLHIVSPFTERDFIHEILNLHIPNEFLIKNGTTKLLPRTLAEKIQSEQESEFRFFDTIKIDYFQNWKEGKIFLEKVGQSLFNTGKITEKHRMLIPNFIEGGMWYENRMRIYLLLHVFFWERAQKTSS